MAQELISHKVLSLDFWQDTVTYAGSVMPTGTIGCAVLNIPDETITRLDTPCMILNQLLTGIGLKNVDMQLLPKAQEAGLDLVKIAPQAKPPVCKIIDYGKYRYELARKEKEARKKQKTIDVKEVRLSPNIDTNDLKTKVNAARKFLSKGDRVKVTLRFRGREMAHMSSSRHVLDDFADLLSDIATVEKAPKVEGRSMTMFLTEKR